MGLTTVESEVSFSPTRSDAESLARALLAHAGDGNASPVGGSVRLSLYGVNPVEVSRNVATVNLAANALQLSRDALYLACQAIANTLTTLPEIEWVNFLVVDRPVGPVSYTHLSPPFFAAARLQNRQQTGQFLLFLRVQGFQQPFIEQLFQMRLGILEFLCLMGGIEQAAAPVGGVGFPPELSLIHI